MTWTEVLAPIKKTEEFQQLWKRVEQEYAEHRCFPPRDKIFRATKLTPFEAVKVVILGQDPYHGEHQATGLSFSVEDEVKTPPSLRNIFKELKVDVGIEKNRNELDDWAKQGVLLLNAVLTVRAHEANSHQKLGWEFFTDFIIRSLSEKREHVVFVMWGAFAQKKESLIDASKHLVIKSVHPSPLSVHRGFFGSRPFSKINEYLSSKGQKPISW